MICSSISFGKWGKGESRWTRLGNIAGGQTVSQVERRGIGSVWRKKDSGCKEQKLRFSWECVWVNGRMCICRLVRVRKGANGTVVCMRYYNYLKWMVILFSLVTTAKLTQKGKARLEKSRWLIRWLIVRAVAILRKTVQVRAEALPFSCPTARTGQSCLANPKGNSSPHQKPLDRLKECVCLRNGHL